MAKLEHVNITVADPKATAAWMVRLFDWHVRWEGPVLGTGYTVHVGNDEGYVALFGPGKIEDAAYDRHRTPGALNHIAVTVDDLDAAERAVRAEGFTPSGHADYEPGHRFYFMGTDGIEVEVVSYN